MAPQGRRASISTAATSRLESNGWYCRSGRRSRGKHRIEVPWQVQCAVVHLAIAPVPYQTKYRQQELLMKHALYFALGGALIGIALTTWLAPGMIAWYFNPPVEMGGFSCTAPIQWALRRLQGAQLWGVVVGGALGLVTYGVVQVRHRRKQVQSGHSLDGNSNEQVPNS
jgi:hypothetical protein